MNSLWSLLLYQEIQNEPSVVSVTGLVTVSRDTK